MSKKRGSGIFSLENRALLERLDQLERALTRNSVDSLKEILRSLEEQLLMHRRREEEALYPAMARHLPGHGEPVTRRRIRGREHGDRLRELRDHVHMDHRGRILHQGHRFVSFLRAQLLEADTLLLPLADRLLSPEEWDRVRRDFESIGSPSRSAAPNVVSAQ